jgi:hypothetical protein
MDAEHFPVQIQYLFLIQIYIQKHSCKIIYELLVLQYYSKNNYITSLLLSSVIAFDIRWRITE